MSQRVILQKMAKYVRLPKETPLSGTTLRLSHQLIQGGFCYGFSICWSLMARLGERRRWMAMLAAIATWDGQEESLNEVISLPSDVCAAGIRQSLREIFEYVVANVVMYQGYGFDFELKLASNWERQLSILEPQSCFVEVLSSHGDIEKIEARKLVSGYFSANKLALLLNQMSNLQDCHFIITNVEHAIAIQFVDRKCIVYDPNYVMSAASEAMYSHPLGAAEEIIEILGNSLLFTITSTKAQSLAVPLYDKWLMSSGALASLLQDKGLAAFLDAGEQSLEQLVQLVAKQDSFLAYQALWNSFSRLYGDNSMFCEWAEFYPKSFQLLFDLLKRDSKAVSLFARELTRKDQKPNGLLAIAKGSVEIMAEMLELVIASADADIGKIVVAARLLSENQQKVFIQAFVAGIQNYSYQQLSKLCNELYSVFQVKKTNLRAIMVECRVFGKRLHELTPQKQILFAVLAKMYARVMHEVVALLLEPLDSQGFLPENLQLMLTKLEEQDISLAIAIDKADLSPVKRQSVIDLVADTYWSAAADSQFDLLQRLEYLKSVPAEAAKYVEVNEVLQSVSSQLQETMVQLLQMRHIRARAKLFAGSVSPGVSKMIAAMAWLQSRDTDPIKVFAEVTSLLQAHITTESNDPIYKRILYQYTEVTEKLQTMLNERLSNADTRASCRKG